MTCHYCDAAAIAEVHPDWTLVCPHHLIQLLFELDKTAKSACVRRPKAVRS